jgi:hypothetical protein
MNNRERLMELITQHGLDRHEVADLVRVRRETVDHWLLSHESRAHEEVPEMAVELLELKLKYGLKKRAEPAAGA